MGIVKLKRLDNDYASYLGNESTRFQTSLEYTIYAMWSPADDRGSAYLDQCQVACNGRFGCAALALMANFCKGPQGLV